MAIPVYLQQFKAAGVYRVVFDKSTVLNQDATILRLVVGYSEKGPFNIPTYIPTIQDFKAMYGDISKKLEKRGDYFHRVALDCLRTGPILCLNLKKFENEVVTGAQVDTNFNSKYSMDTVKIPVEDIYDTTRFWELSAEKLNDVRGAEYINIATTNTKATSGTFFIRKASGSKVSAFNVTVSDWYKDAHEDVPEFLQGFENQLMSAFMAEVYVFNGKFTADQVLSSDTLKNYFIVGTDGKLRLRQYVKDSFGDYEDTLDALYNDETSGAIGHYVGSLIPNFVDKNGVYASLDIVFNQDQEAHNMMMSFNVDMLEEYGTANIDLSGARYISTDTSIPENRHSDVANGHELANEYKQYGTTVVCIRDIWKGNAQTSLMGNIKSPVVADEIEFSTSLYNDNNVVKYPLQWSKTKKITGAMYVKSVSDTEIILGQVGQELQEIKIDMSEIVGLTENDINYILYKLGAAYKYVTPSDDYQNTEIKYVRYESGLGTMWNHIEAYAEPFDLQGPKQVIRSLGRDLDSVEDSTIVLAQPTIKCNIEDVYITTRRHFKNSDILVDPSDDSETWAVYGSSASFIPVNEEWKLEADQDQLVGDDEDIVHTYTLRAPATSDMSMLAMLQKGDQFLATDSSVDMDGDGDYDDEVQNGFYDLCYVQETGTKYDENGIPAEYYIKFTGEVSIFEGDKEAADKDEIISAAAYDLLEDSEKFKTVTASALGEGGWAEGGMCTDGTPVQIGDICIGRVEKVHTGYVDYDFDANGKVVIEEYVSPEEFAEKYNDTYSPTRKGITVGNKAGISLWLPYEYAVTYDKIDEKIITAKNYEQIKDTPAIELGFNPYKFQFVKQVNAIEYTLLNANAKAQCVSNKEAMEAVPGGEWDGSYTFLFKDQKTILTADEKAELIAADTTGKVTEDKFAPVYGYTGTITEDNKVVYNNVGPDGQPVDATTLDPVGYVYVTANPDLQLVDGAIFVNICSLNYDGKDLGGKAGYVVTYYCNKTYNFGQVIEMMSAEKFESIRPISDEEYQALADAVTTAQNNLKTAEDKLAAIDANTQPAAWTKAKRDVTTYTKLLNEAQTKYESYFATTGTYTINDNDFTNDSEDGGDTGNNSGHYLKGMANLVAVVSQWIKPATGDVTTTYTNYLVRIERGLNQEIGEMHPVYLEGYTYEHPKPDGTGMMAKLKWQQFMLSALTTYKGLRTGLLNKAEIDYRYVIDGFETFVEPGAKKVLSFLCKEKQSAFAILNFPSVKTFTKCPYTSFTDSKGVFNVKYVVDGYNKKKACVQKFSLPSNDEGASFCAFYTPLKFSDGFVTSCLPSAGLVSNLFMEKYLSRQPYYIVAGPTYGVISASGLIGPDYHYSQDELQIIEPYGVNCMVYRPNFGTFINANQTAKQTPKSALSAVNVRELVIYLMDEVEKVLQAYQWEFNNQTVRNKIKDRADAICARIAANGGIQAYLNVMDESNNTPEVIDNEMGILSTHIEPGRGMGKMVHELTLYKTGAMRSTILGE